MVPNGGGRVTVLEVRADTARDYDKQEEWVKRNVVKFSEGKWKVLHLGQSNLRQQYRLGIDCQRTSWRVSSEEPPSCLMYWSITHEEK